MSARSQRRPHLDWLRGIGVLIMIEGHALDAWTRAADRDSDAYRFAILVAGIGAPLFLFLAGVTVSLAAASRLRRGVARRDVARGALLHGAWIFGLAFLFRLQSMVISGGAFPSSLLKVDILNVMGVAMMAAALLWGAARDDRWRAALFIAATAAVALTTPLVRQWPALGVLPDPLEAYFRPAAGLTTFTLFPWAGFLMAGAAVGLWLTTGGDDHRRNRGLLGLGVAIGAVGYVASTMPAMYEGSRFWTSSPTFFFIRLGILLAALPLADAATRIWAAKPLQVFGRASLFVYWIHVEMAYGVLSLPLHRRLPFVVAVAAFVAFTGLLYALVRLKDRMTGRGRSPQAEPAGPSPMPAPGDAAS